MATTTTKHKPATPLPWTLVSWDANKRTKIVEFAFRGDYPVNLRGLSTGPEQRDAAYIAHAANAYPKLVEALRICAALVHSDGEPVCGQKVRALLRELGEE